MSHGASEHSKLHASRTKPVPTRPEAGGEPAFSLPAAQPPPYDTDQGTGVCGLHRHKARPKDARYASRHGIWLADVSRQKGRISAPDHPGMQRANVAVDKQSTLFQATDSGSRNESNPSRMPGPILFLQPLPKPLCGVSDHTQKLIDALATQGVEGLRVSIDELRGMPEEGLSNARVFVQTSIYGFQRKGVPMALAVEVSRARRCGARVCGFFHETWVPKAPLLTSAYWLRPAQRMVCEWLARRFDRAHFNSSWSLAWGRSIMGDRARFSPTFSNVGEPASRKLLTERPARLVCFGSPTGRRAAYAALSAHMPWLVNSGQVRELFDIGGDESAIRGLMPDLPGLSVHVLGAAKAAEVSAALADARYGLHFTPWSLSTKSGIFGALLAHGVMPISIYECDSLPLPEAADSTAHKALLVGITDWRRRLDAGAQPKDFQPLVDSATSAYKPVAELAREIAADFDMQGYA